MFRYLLIALGAGMPFFARAQCPSTANAITQPFVPPPPYRATGPAGGFWYGSNLLWTWVSYRGFTTSGSDHISAKLVFWRIGFDWRKEPSPDLTVVAKRLDGPAEIVRAQRSNAVRFPDDDTPAGMAMMTGISIPVAGCWELSATYEGRTLSYIVVVKP